MVSESLPDHSRTHAQASRKPPYTAHYASLGFPLLSDSPCSFVVNFKGEDIFKNFFTFHNPISQTAEIFSFFFKQNVLTHFAVEQKLTQHCKTII